MHKYGFQSVGAFEDYLYIDMAEDSSNSLTKARNVRDRNQNVFFTSTPVFEFMMGVWRFLSSCLRIQSG